MTQGRLLDHVGPILREARERAGVSQAVIAERCGVSASTVSRLENGVSWPQDKHMDQLLDVYEVLTGLDPVEGAERAVGAWRAGQ
jgi:transcriptional regulator with XRE-family HTH domain